MISLDSHARLRSSRIRAGDFLISGHMLLLSEPLGNQSSDEVAFDEIIRG